MEDDFWKTLVASLDGGIDSPINDAGGSPLSLTRIADEFQQYNIRGKSRRVLCHSVA